MSILTEALPDYLLIKDVRCPIKTDFKTWLCVSELLAKDILETEKAAQLFYLVFGEKLPPNLYAAMDAVMKFYSHDGRPASGDKQENALQKNYFDFEYDADLIYSAFFQQYKIDLCTSSMHWWKFKALLGGLSEETHFIKVVQYRCMDVSKIKDKEQKRFYLSMKKLHKLPDRRSEEQKEEQLNKALEMLF